MTHAVINVTASRDRPRLRWIRYEAERMDPQLQQSGIFVLFIFLAFLIERGWQWARRRRARRWPAAPGHVHHVDWRQPRTGTKRYFVGSLSYWYFVGDRFYSGYHRRSFSTMDDAVDWSRRMNGAAVRVRYNPQSFERSLLLEDEQPEPALIPQSTVIEDSIAAAGD